MSRAGTGHTARRSYRTHYPAVSVCGLSCRLCPRFHTSSKSRCGGCKSAWRMGAGCALVTCAFKRKGLESCALCKESVACVLLRRHRESGKRHDSFVSYRRVEANAALIARHGIARFDRSQRARERLLRAMLRGYDDGRSKSRYCVAVTVLDGPQIERILRQAGAQSRGMDRSQKAALMREMLSAATAGAGGIGLRS